LEGLAGGRRVYYGAGASAVKEIVTQVLQLDVVLVDCLVSGLGWIESNDHIRGKLNQRNALRGLLQDQKVLSVPVALSQIDLNRIVIVFVLCSPWMNGHVSFHAHHHQANISVSAVDRRYALGRVNSW